MTKDEFKSMSPLEQIRVLSGIFVQDERIMMSHLVLINLITRVELGDADMDFLDSQLDKAFGNQ
jgi:hypothetical protein